MWIAIGAAVVGIILGIWMPYNLTPEMSPYVAISIIAALDSVFGGVAAHMKKTFNITVFFTGFFSNALLAAGLAYLGTVLGINLALAAIVIFGTRMFQNFATMRHILLEKLGKRQKKEVSASEDKENEEN
ncbi:MAG: DUF1290 domain-containing protein [Oscillospiraceae bacterium]|nr:DUF1290 domain-containing protein [Oscillospiraceae bacterium]